MFYSLCFLFQFSIVSAQKVRKQPNIIFIICDQMRGDAFGAYGNNVVNTPNLDKFANERAMFAKAFVNNSVCLSAKVFMLSSKYPNVTGQM